MTFSILSTVWNGVYENLSTYFNLKIKKIEWSDPFYFSVRERLCQGKISLVQIERKQIVRISCNTSQGFLEDSDEDIALDLFSFLLNLLQKGSFKKNNLNIN